jgi:hypothetical protein
MTHRVELSVRGFATKAPPALPCRRAGNIGRRFSWFQSFDGGAGLGYALFGGRAVSIGQFREVAAAEAHGTLDGTLLDATLGDHFDEDRGVLASGLFDFGAGDVHGFV